MPRPQPSPIQGAIDEMVRRIVARFDPEKIVLFGSHARGEAKPESDVDLLVILPIEGSRRELAAQIDLELAGLGVSKDIIVTTPNDVRRYGHLVGTILRPALREGVVLHERRT